MKAFSLPELSLTLLIALGLATIAIPTFSESRKSAQFQAFACEITAHFAAAKRSAAISGQSVILDFDREGPWLFRMSRNGQLISSKKRLPAQHNHIPQLSLPHQELTHPTTGRVLTEPLSSTHGDKIIFGQRGSSSATLIFSHGPDRVLCLVISGSTGRMRAYTLQEQSWVDFQ